MYDAWNRRDADLMAQLSHLDVEYVNSPTAVEPGTRRGLAEVQRVAQKQWEILGDTDQEIESLERRGGVILTLSRVTRRMPGSDARVEVKVLMAWTVRAGKVARMEVLGVGQDEIDAAHGEFRAGD